MAIVSVIFSTVKCEVINVETPAYELEMFVRTTSDGYCVTWKSNPYSQGLPGISWIASQEVYDLSGTFAMKTNPGEVIVKNAYRRAEADVGVNNVDSVLYILAETKLRAYQLAQTQCSNWLMSNQNSIKKRANQEKAIEKRQQTGNVIENILSNGPSANRIDMVLMGDGYTSAELPKFKKDMQDLTTDMFYGPTFSNYRPLFNVWTIFSPSVESGLGVGGKFKNTTLKLYRDGTELRAIYPGPGGEDRARELCKLTGQFACEYPSIIANDLYYGGLGGKFVIATASPTAGSVVLRHEMGHNMINVGEEYDGGAVYTGPNSATTSSLNSLPWSSWTSAKPVTEEPQNLVLQKYSWYNLAKGPLTYTFTMTGTTYPHWFMRFSASGVNQPGDLVIKIDGVQLPWSPRRNSVDRFFYEYFNTFPLSKGSHTLTISSGAAPTGAMQQFCSVALYEYGTNFHFDNNWIGAFPTFNDKGIKTYRPTNEGCLMRNMTRNSFCSVCVEGLWKSLLNKINLIDEITQISPECLKVNVIPLAHLRNAKSLITGETYTFNWEKKTGNSFNTFTNFSISDDKLTYCCSSGAWAGSYRVNLIFTTPQIKNPAFLSFTRSITVT